MSYNVGVRMNLRVSFALLVLLVHAVCCEERTIIFGISLGLNATESRDFGGAQQDTLEGLMVWKDWFNSLNASARTTPWGMTFKVDLHVADDSKFADTPQNEQIMFDVYRDMALNSSIDYLFSPVASPWDIQARNYTYYVLGVPVMVAPLDSSEAYYAIPGSYGAPTANILALTSWLPYLRVARASTVAILKGDENFLRELCSGVSDQASLNDLTVPLDFSMPFDYTTLGSIVGDPSREAAWTAALNQIIAVKPDAVAVCDYGYGAEFALKYFKRKNWTPKAFMMSNLYVKFDDPSLLDFVSMPSYYHASARFPAQTNFTTSAGYDALVRAKFNKAANDIHARATLAGMIFSSAILSTKSNTSDELDRVLASNQFRSFMGTSAFDASRRQMLLALVTQLMANGTTRLVIGPAQAAADEYIYPMPSWEERIFKHKWGNAVEITGLVLILVGVAITLGWAIFLFIHWNHKVIVAASPVFCMTILLGSMLILVSILNWMPNLINNAICSLRAWLLPLGFFLMFGSLIAKTDRINRLYNSKGLEIIVIPNTQVALIISVICGIQVIISILMVTISKPKAQINVVDQYRVSQNYWICTFPKSLKILFWVDLGFAVLLLLWGSYLAYRIRTVPISIYDESKVIAFAIYNTAFFGVTVIVIQLAVGNANRNVTFIVTAICCFLGAVVTTSTLFIAKWFAIYRPRKFSKTSSNNTTRTTLSSSVTSSSGNDSKPNGGDSAPPSPSAEDPGENFESKKLKKKIKALKARNAELRERISQLEALDKSHGLLDETGSTQEEMDDAKV